MNLNRLIMKYKEINLSTHLVAQEDPKKLEI